MNSTVETLRTKNGGKSARLRFIAICGAAVAVSLFILACDGSIAAPGNEKVVRRGNQITTVWTTDGGSLTYAGAATSQVVDRQKDSSLSTAYGPFRSIKLSMAEIDRRRSAVEPKALELSLRVMKAISPSGQSSPSGPDMSTAIFRPSFGQPMTQWRSPEGRDIGFQMLTKKDLGVTASLLFVDGRAVALAEFGYTKKSGKWKTSRMRSTFFDARGRPRMIVDTDLSDVNDVTSNVASLLKESSIKGVSWLNSTLKARALPDAAYAATTELPGMDCWPEFLAASTLDARAAFWAAAALIAGAECPTPLAAFTCIAAASALEAYFVALRDYKRALDTLAACRRAHGHCFDEYRGVDDGLNIGLRLDCEMPGEDDGDGPGGGSNDCEWFTYQISYDGGVTWQNYGEPFQICVDMT
jgi:hypothetical protein